MSPPNPPLPAADEDEGEVAEEEIVEEEEEEEEEYEEEEVEEIEEEVEEEEKQVEKKEEEKPQTEEKEEEKEVEEKVLIPSVNDQVGEKVSIPSFNAQVKEKVSIPSINDVVNFNATLSEFVSQWEGLQHFLDAIGASIDARSEKLDALQIPPPSDKPDKQAVAAAVKEETKPVQEKPSSDDPRAELHSICETMGGRFLRKFVCTHLSDLAWLRREVPAALGRAPDPPKLVFDAIGRFYLQGSKAYERNPTVINGRRACILILEFYVLSGCPSGLDSTVKENARVAAIAWRSRLVSEGGVKSATSVDALGLALFAASFGIPPEFDCEVMYDLLRLSNLKKKANVFHQSPILHEKIPDIIEELLSKDMHVEAVDLACAFGLKEKFPPIPLLSSVLQKSWLTAKEEPRGQSSLKSLKEASEKQLAVLKSVVKCLEDNQLDPSEVASFNMYEKIAELETDIAKVELKLKNKNFKRMAVEVGLSKKPETQAKRSWPASVEASPGVPPHLMKQTQKKRSPALSESKDLYTSFIPQSMHDDGFTGSHNGSSMGFLTGGVHGSAGVGSSLVAAATADGAGPTAGNDIRSYANINGSSYGWHQDGVLDDRSVAARSYSGFAPSAGWMGPSAAAAQSLYQPQASSLGIHRSSGSNLYRFADIVLERESYYNSSTSTAMPGAANPSYYSSYPS